MLAASQDIDSFIERQRSQLNKQATRQPPPQASRQLPPQSSIPPNNIQDRLDFKVARILDDPPPRIQSQQPYYPQPPPQPPLSFAPGPGSVPQSFNDDFPPDQLDNSYSRSHLPRRRLSDDRTDDNPAAFFNKFGTYDDKRTQLKDDLKREYNEYLQSKKNTTKSKSTSQLASPRQNQNNKRVQFQQPNGKVVAPWEKNDNNKSARTNRSTNDLPTASVPVDFPPNRSRPPNPRNDYDEQYIRDRESYVAELHEQIRELEARKRQLELERNKLPVTGSANVARAHYSEDLNALNSLLAERLDQRNAVDHELAHILNRPPISASPTRIGSGGVGNFDIPFEPPPPQQQGPPRRYPQQAPPPQRSQNGRNGPAYHNGNRADQNPSGLVIGQEVDKDSEKAAKKRYQQELQEQMREAQMRKAKEKQARDDYEKKLDADIQRYNYFGRSGGGAPLRDKDGNVLANLSDARNPQGPPPPQQQSSMPPHHQQQQQQQQQYYPPNDKVYSLGDGFSSVGNGGFYNGEQGPNPSNSERAGSPSHARGAVSNGIFGTAKTEAQLVREEKYKLDLKKQIDEKRQREADEAARRRAEEERELAKHLEWQQQMEKQSAEEALRKQQREEQERQQQQLKEERERQKKQEEVVAKRKPKRLGKPVTPKRDETIDGNDHYDEQTNGNDQQPTEAAFRSSSPPIPALQKKDKKKKPPPKNIRRPSYDEIAQQQTPPPPVPPLDNNDDFIEPQSFDEPDDRGRQTTYRKPPTPRQPEVSSARKRPPQQTYRSRPPSNSGMPMRTNSMASLRSDGSDSEVLNRLEHLKRQLKDKEARLQDHVARHQTDQSSNKDERSKGGYLPPTQMPLSRNQSPQFLMNAARVHHHRDSPVVNDKSRRIFQTDDDHEFKPSYFRDDAILMGANGDYSGPSDNEYYLPPKRVDSSNGIFNTNIEREANRRKYGHGSQGLFENEDPTSMANYELNRIAQQNEQRLKKLRDLEHDDASLLDSNEVLERFQQKQRLQRGGSQTTLQDDAWLK